MSIDERMRLLNKRFTGNTTVYDFTDGDYEVIKSLIIDLAGVEQYRHERQAMVFLKQAIEAAREVKAAQTVRKRRRMAEKVTKKFNAAVRAIDRGEAQNGV